MFHCLTGTFVQHLVLSSISGFIFSIQKEIKNDGKIFISKTFGWLVTKVWPFFNRFHLQILIKSKFQTIEIALDDSRTLSPLSLSLFFFFLQKRKFLFQEKRRQDQ